MQEHATGRLMGEIPEAWLQSNNLEQCSVCARILSTRYGGTCPRCRPTLRHGVARHSSGRPVPVDWPTLEEVMTARIHTRAHVPNGARKLWSQCVTAALSEVARHNDLRAWIQLLSLPKM
eukprot:7158402-Karenia_brevis.AAC.1